MPGEVPTINHFYMQNEFHDVSDDPCNLFAHY